MDQLDRIQEDARHVCKALETSPLFERAIRSKRAKKFNRRVYEAMIDQAHDVVTPELFSLIAGKIGKALSPEEAEKRIREIRAAIEEMWEELGIYAKPVFFKEYYKYVYEVGGQYFLDAHNIPSAFDLTNREILFKLEGRADALIKSVDDTTKDWLSRQIEKVVEGEYTYQYAAEKILDRIPETYKGRSMAITRTETNNMVNEGEWRTAKNNGASHKHWAIVPSTACPICEQNESEGIVGIDHTFSSGHQRPPAHPNCYCTVEYEFAPFQSFVWHGQ